MNTKNNIKSKFKPDAIEINGETVYKRSNITETVEIDPIFNTEDTFYTYDEEQYTLAEWNHIKIDSLESTIEILKAEVEHLKQHMK